MSSLLSHNTPPPDEKIYLDELGPNDVLLGRGTGPNENRGNVTFRGLLKERIDKQLREKKDEWTNNLCYSRHIAIDVMDIMRSAGGHFVRKLTIDEIRACSEKLGKPCQYVVVSDKVAREKAKQSIRFLIGISGENTKDKNQAAAGGGDADHKGQGTTKRSKSKIAILKQPKGRGGASSAHKDSVTAKSKSTNAIHEAKRRGVSSALPPPDPQKLKKYKAVPLTTVAATKESSIQQLDAARAGSHPGTSIDTSIGQAERTRLYSQEGTDVLENCSESPSSSLLLLPRNSLLSFSTGAATLQYPTTTTTIPAANMTPLLATEHQAAYYELCLAYQRLLIKERQVRRRLLMARTAAATGVGGGYYPPPSGGYPLFSSNPPLYMLHGAASTHPDMLSDVVIDDPLPPCTSPYILPDTTDVGEEEDLFLHRSFSFSSDLRIPTPVPSTLQPVPSAALSS